MIKIAHAKEVAGLSLAKEIIDVALAAVKILDDEYGENRNVDYGDGGYVLVIEEKDEFEMLKAIHIDVEEIVPEYVDIIECDDGRIFVSSLLLLGSDFGIVLIIPLSMMPVNLWKYSVKKQLFGS